MTKPAFRHLAPLLLLSGCAPAMSDEATTADAAAPSFSQSPSDVVLRVTWSDARTPRKWSRSFFGDGRVEAADIGFDGKAVDPTRTWSVDEARLASALSAAVKGELTSSSQEQMLERVRITGRPPAYPEDEISLTVELRFSRSGSSREARVERVRVFGTRDPLGMARRFPEIPQLAALAHLFEFARHSEPR